MMKALSAPGFQTLAHNALRIAAGAAFFTHGGQKLFAWFGAEQSVDLMSAMGVAGVLETFGGLAMILGLFAQPVAFLLSGEMAVAYFWRHVGGSGELFWWANRGELPLLYCFIWLFFAAKGAGAFSVDAKLKKAE